MPFARLDVHRTALTKKVAWLSVPAAKPKSADLAEQGASSRSVHIVYEARVWHLWSEDGEVGGVFVSHDAARRFAEREFGGEQERLVVDDGPADAPDEET